MEIAPGATGATNPLCIGFDDSPSQSSNEDVSYEPQGYPNEQPQEKTPGVTDWACHHGHQNQSDEKQ